MVKVVRESTIRLRQHRSVLRIYGLILMEGCIMSAYSKNLLDLSNAARIRGDDVEADILYLLYTRSIENETMSTLNQHINN